MKHIKFITKLAMVVAGSFMLASFSPSLDGRAVVVDEGLMPSGLFAKTVGYLPGDVISVSNVAGNSTVDLLVIGALDASEGVAIMLTPEAAKAVGIEKDSNSIVKITKRNGQDDRVYGNAVISSDKKAAQQAPASQKTAALDNPSADSVAEEVFQEEAPVEEITQAAAGSPMFEESPAEEEVSAAAPVAAPVIEKAEDTSEAQARAAERLQNAPEEELAKTPAEETEFEKLVDEMPAKNESAAVAALPLAVSEEDAEELDEIEEIQEPLENSITDNQEVVIDEFVSADDDENYDSYEAIVLVPSVANPPVSDQPGDISPVPGEASILPKTANPDTPAPKTMKPLVNYQDFVVVGEKDLIRNSYYVQIATMRDDANIQEVVNKYGNNYPITIVQLSNNSKQILIGSLSMDEYAVVLERFKSYGYKDAFLRKIR